LVQATSAGQERQVAPPGEAADCDIVVALGGDGTTLAAVRAAAPAGKPVLGVACGSLGALTATSARELTRALERVADGDWQPRRLAAIVVEAEGEETLLGVNDVVVVREGASQVAAEVRVDGELFIRFAGDGLVVATALGSSAYTLAAGGPVLGPSAEGLVLTPLAAHGGCCPPLVASGASRLSIEVEPGHGGARIELDGQVRARLARLERRSLTVSLRPDHATLVALGGEEPMLAGLRRRQVLIDSPRMLARETRGIAVPGH
jgi:NAD+ kinase